MDSLILRDLSASGFAVACESDHHRKALPCFSVVQALRGSYDIGLDDGPVCSTGEGGVFVTPPGCMQHITHHNGREGFLEAQWVFFDVLVTTARRFLTCSPSHCSSPPSTTKRSPV